MRRKTVYERETKEGWSAKPIPNYPPPPLKHLHITTRPPIIVLFLTTYPVPLPVIRDHIYQPYSN